MSRRETHDASRFSSLKEAEDAYEMVKRTCGMPFGQWLFGTYHPMEEVNNADDVCRIMMEKCHIPESSERMWVICLDSENMAMCDPIDVGQGCLHHVLADSRSIFGPAVWWGAASIVMVHNHPGGDTAPSNTDISLTRDMKACGEVLMIPLADHVIVTKDGRYSSIRTLHPRMFAKRRRRKR